VRSLEFRPHKMSILKGHPKPHLKHADKFSGGGKSQNLPQRIETSSTVGPGGEIREEWGG